MNDLPAEQLPFYLCGAERWKLGAEGARTFFAPPGRSSPEEFGQERSRVLSLLGLQAAIDAMPNCVAILNWHRQIVLANASLKKLLGAEEPEVLGYRLGEALGCAHWKEAPEGCGTGWFCTTCGAVAAIWESQRTHGRPRYECRFTPESADRNSLDLRIAATVVGMGESEFVICVIENIADQKRLEALSRTFFHDLLNTAGGIRGYAEHVADIDVISADEKQCLGRLHFLSDLLLEEIASFRDLSDAEAGELVPRWGEVRAAALLDELRILYEKHSVGQGRKLALGEIWDGPFVSDANLLRRVIGNMIKNALEATPPGGTVTLGCEAIGDRVLFHVHNPGTIPPETQLQIFQRSFSTKGEQGRGIGAYAMKLLGERYLGGHVSFTSDETAGTIFTISLPRERIVSS